MSTKIRCFISYTWADWQKEFARKFAAALRKFPDLDVWIDDEQILPGQSLYKRLEDGLRRESDCAICLLSAEYLRSENCAKELEEAHSLCNRYYKPLLPIKLGEIEMPFILRGKVYQKFRQSRVTGWQGG